MSFTTPSCRTLPVDDEVDRVSTAGYALGYIGGGTLLALNLAWILKPEWFGLPAVKDLLASRARCPVVSHFCRSRSGGWSFRSRSFAAYRSRPAVGAGRASGLPVRAAIDRLIETGRSLRSYRQAFLMLLAFLIYNDGIGTIMRMATRYGDEIGIDQEIMIGAIVLVQFVGIPFAFLFGMLAGRIGAKRSIALGLVGYTVICIFGYFMKTRQAFLDAGDHGRRGAGGNAGPEPLVVRQPDPPGQVGRVFRLLRRRREICRASSGRRSSVSSTS